MNSPRRVLVTATVLALAAGLAGCAAEERVWIPCTPMPSPTLAGGAGVPA